jgi:hypothetical protein
MTILVSLPRRPPSPVSFGVHGVQKFCRRWPSGSSHGLAAELVAGGFGDLGVTSGACSEVLRPLDSTVSRRRLDFRK